MYHCHLRHRFNTYATLAKPQSFSSSSFFLLSDSLVVHVCVAYLMILHTGNFVSQADACMLTLQQSDA
jgi:hypothetical protein